MSRGLASLISMIGTTMGGYAQGARMYDQKQRQDRLDAQQQEEYGYQKTQREKAAKIDSDLAASQADQQVEELPAAAPTGNADLSMAGEMATPSYRANGVAYGDRGAAEQALVGVNSAAAKAQRAADAMRANGQIEKAMQYDTFAKKALDEGTDKILGTIQASAPSVEAVKKAGGMVAGAVGQQAADVFNKTGSHWKVSPDTVVQHFIDKDAAGREFVNSRVLGKDGKPVVDDVRAANLMLADMKTRFEAQQNDTRTFQTGQQIAESGRHNKAQEEIARQAAETAAAHVRIAQQSLKLQQDAAYRATPAGQIAELEKANGAPLTADQKMEKLGLSRISKPDQMLVASILKSQEQLDQARAKAMADGSFAPDSPGAKELAAQTAANNLKLNKVLGKYGEAGKGGASADPLGIFSDAPAAPGAAPRPAARGVAPSATSIPPEPQRYIAGQKGENPEYTAWQQKYGAAIDAARARHLGVAFRTMHD
jgi:hypothetical protein